MTKCVAKEIVKETSSLSKRSETNFKIKSTDDLLNFDWEHQYKNIKQRLPTLTQILTTMDQKKQKSMARFVVAVSVLLYARSQLLNLMQFTLGLVLDGCGLNKEGLNIMHDLGLAVSYTSIRKKRKELVKKQEANIDSVISPQNSGNCVEAASVEENVEETVRKVSKPIEILGDNLDITIAPSHMAIDKQRRSLHWFLTLVKQRRVTYDDLNVPTPGPVQEPILKIAPHSWIPSEAHMKSLEENFVFHISKTLLKYIDFLKPVTDAYPKYIEHQFMHITKQKSVIFNCDLIEASENSSQGMIHILQKVHELAVPHVDGKLEQKVVFGGDVLTNERAFSAQQAMQNNNTEYDCLLGTVHRPEGLHREFNFLLGIYQLFYTSASARDTGSPYQLRNLINRRDVTGAQDVVQKFRPHQDFLEDVTDGYLVAACLDIMDLDDITSSVKQPINIMSDEHKVEFVNSIAKKVINSLEICEKESISQLRADLAALHADDCQVEAMKVGDQYTCCLCDKTYTALKWFKQHLIKKHQWNFHRVNEDAPVSNALKHFLFMSLLFRDTCDSYKMCDGERSVRNAHFEWLYDSSLKHSKYKIWLWRMVSYSKSLLGSKESFEYMWNMSVNLHGGSTNNIPNDNAVELQVHNIKRELNCQGANKSFESAKQICMTTQVVSDIKENLIKSTRTARAKRVRPPVNKSGDIKRIVDSLRLQGPVKDLHWNSFSTFRNPLDCIHGEELYNWINSQKKIAHMLM